MPSLIAHASQVVLRCFILSVRIETKASFSSLPSSLALHPPSQGDRL
jgi:hypothetical protein